MRRIHVAGSLTDNMTITGAKAHHLARVLRITTGEQLAVVDDAGASALVKVACADGDKITLDLVQRDFDDKEPRAKVSLALALLKGDKLEFVIQKAVELGVHSLGIFCAQHSVVRVDNATMDKKKARYRAIAAAAAEQGGRVRIPEVLYGMKLQELLEKFPADTRIIALHEQQNTRSLRTVLGGNSDQPCVLVVGPEGGLSERELEQARLITAGLGPRVLRADTAAIAGLACALYENGDLD